MSTSSPTTDTANQTTAPCGTCGLPEPSPIHDPGAGGHAFEESTTEPGLFTCPDWCGDPDEHTNDDLKFADREDGFEIVLNHGGPHFGPFSTEAEVNVVTGESLPIVMCDEVAVMNLANQTEEPAKLRELARDAQRAALWLESHR